MPVHDIVVLALIAGVFSAFGILLASVSWYCRPSRVNPERADHSHVPANWLVDD